jgi:hypothetical protein
MIALLFPFAILFVIVGYAAHGRSVAPRDLLRVRLNARRGVGRVLLDWVRLADEPAAEPAPEPAVAPAAEPARQPVDQPANGG